MAFTIRTTAPDGTEQWWNTSYSPCITGNASEAAAIGATIPNCFAGETEVITSTGIFKMVDLVDKTIEVMTADETWHTATVKCFGVQELVELHIGRSTYYCTKNHRWLVESQSHKSRRFITTQELDHNKLIPYAYTKCVEYSEDTQAVIHGFIFGDGCAGYKNRTTSAMLCGKKRAYMMSYFADTKMYHYSDGTIEVPNQIKHGKNLPPLTSSKLYLYNFLRGYFAADGTVDAEGSTIELCCKHSETLEYIRSICGILGIRCGRVRTNWSWGYTGWAPASYLSFHKQCLTEQFFINPDHRVRFSKVAKKNILCARGGACIATARIEPVYCVVEPVTHTFTLGGGELTGNCVGYAWGRFAEILGSYPTGLPTGNAGTWYDECSAYQKGSTPQVGAVMVFKKAGAAGHVAIVEEVYSDGSVMTSESGWSSGWTGRFWNDTRTPPLYTTNTAYEFVGFIYNPNASSTSNTNNSTTSNAVPITSAKHPAQIMINEANSHAGSGGHAWVQANTAIGNQAWCAATCCAVVKACGYNGKIAPDNIYTAGGFGEAVINTYGGSRIDGPGRGNTNATPQIGDFIVCEKGGEAYHIGMVRGVEGDKVLTVEGNTDGGQYLMKDRDLHSANIGYYARPDWTKVGGTSNVGNGTQVGGNLYTTKSTQEDASLREVCYLDKDAKPSIQTTSIKLSVINYTGILGLLTTIFGGVSGGASTSGTDNIDGLDPIPREIVSYFQGKGLCTAAGIGIIANIKAESSFDTAAVNAPYGAYGLCQWRLDRAVAMKKMAGSNWSSNLTGQLDYLWYELSTDEYLSLLTTLQNSPNTLEGAKTCTDKFIRDFERSENIDAYSKLRQGYAEEFWKKVVVSSNTASPSGETSAAQGKITTQSGRQITQGNPITIPTDLSQSGIISDYTYYDRDWSSGTTQRTLYDIWVSQGKPSSYGIATIAGYYLVATRPKYGLSGTLITVVLEDNTYFNAIIADTKAGDRSEGFTEWGHTFSTGDSLIEWEALVSQSELNTNLENAGWYGKKVLKIVTYESWLDGSKT